MWCDACPLSIPCPTTLHLPAGYKKPSVTAVKFDLPAYQVPASAQPPGSVPTLLRMLSCSHPQQAHTVINHLIDVVSLATLLCTLPYPAARLPLVTRQNNETAAPAVSQLTPP